MEDTIKRNIETKDEPKKVETPETNNEPTENVTPSWFQRAAAGTIDVGLLIFLFIILVAVFRISGLGDSLNKYKDEAMIIQKNYATTLRVEGSEETYYHKVYLNEENMLKYENTYQFSDEGDDKKYVIEIIQTDDKDLLKRFDTEFKKLIDADKKYQASFFNYRLVDYGINMLAVSIGYAILILIIPLCNKRRISIGQYLAGIRCINASVPTPARWWKIVIRYFWVMIIEVALPCLSILGIYGIIVTPLVLYIIALFNKKKRTIRDYVTSTRFVDNKTYVPFGQN